MCALLLLIWIVKVLLHNSSDNFIFLGAETVVITWFIVFYLNSKDTITQ